MTSTPLRLDESLASKFAQLALGHLTREFPNKLDHVMAGPQDALTPRVLHPIFYGSFDWHSCVHGYWLIARLYQRFPALPEATAIKATIDAHFTPANVAAEVAYLQRSTARGFERPYGWAWLLALAAQLHEMPGEDAQRWSAAIEPLSDAFVERFQTFLPKATYSLRVGTHFNSAFALALALDYARAKSDSSLEALIVSTARHWYGADRGCQAWEPGGDEFLSPALMEAELMRRILPAAEFLPWFDEFLPDLHKSQPATLFTPATVSDRSDGKLAHLDGLNLSRAWCQRSLASALPANDPRATLLRDTAEHHLRTGIEHVAGDYMGEHWLASFATLALEA